LPITKKEIPDEAILKMVESAHQRERGFRLLLEKYQERLYWQIRRMVVGHEDANDVLQNCLLKTFRGLPNFQGNSKLYTWMYRIASNEAITYLKKQNKRTFASLDDASNSLENQLRADDFFDGNEAQIQLQKALKTLPAKQLEVFNLRYFEEMPYQKISELLGTSVGGLKASFHHAVKKVEAFILKGH
jgi:RNA polymerase sigma-70 factor (ECF subfamily)